jgi:glycosyltransferase involved in cell wall biosynthesis
MSTPMRVAMVTTHPIQYQVPWLQRLSAREGIELTVFFAMVPDAAEQGREFGVAFAWDLPLLEGYRYQVLENRARNPSATEFAGCDTPGVGRELRKGGFDAVIVNGWGSKTSLQALLACRMAGIPCIVRGEANGLRPRAAWKRLGHRSLLRQYARYLCIGSNNRAYYESLGVPPSRIYLTPYCVDNQRFRDGAEQHLRLEGKEALRLRFGLQPELPTFLFSGKFVDKKRPMDVVEALRLVEQRGGRAQVLMVGDGPLRGELESAAQGLPVRFTGFLNQSEITAAYAASDCLLLPSTHGETWGLVVNEAMACGLTAIVSDQVGSAVDLVTPGLTGERFPCGDVNAFAGCIEELSRDPARLAAMGKSARERVNGGYTFDHVVEGVVAALASL